ncbi:hypothetical protein ACOYW6_03805 [Parablastomonas sp. CN1-191]|uniref:hypothetical protein n=1 Tax=Parablastomonas sp. CN1-191 TaxID=3400908 RepID=UPI003BF83034
MRIAVLTMLDVAGPADPAPRATLGIAGASVARQQVALALALGCERILVLAAPGLPGIDALEQAAVRGGAKLSPVSGAHGVVGGVTAADEVIVLADGLFASTGEAAQMLGGGAVVLTQPIEQGLAAGFERIDLNNAAAGAMRIPGRLVERLAELPADCDVTSALQRIALQAGVPQHPIPTPGSNGLFWTLVRSEDEAHALEPQWIRQRTRSEVMKGPGHALALAGVRRFGAALLHGGGAWSVGLGAAALLLMAAGAGGLGAPRIGFVCAALAWLAQQAFALLGRVESDRPSDDGWLAEGSAIVLDIVLVALMVWALPVPVGVPLWQRLFAPVMLIGLLRLARVIVPTRWTGWLIDRALLAVVLLIADVSGNLAPAIALLALLLVVLGLAMAGRKARLTGP